MVSQIPTLFLALIQSYRLFRAQVEDNIRPVVRNLWPLALLSFLFTFSFAALSAFAVRAYIEDRVAVDQTIQAIGIIQLSAVNLDATHPLQLTVEDLAKAAPLSESTRRWLRRARITIVPMHPLPHHYSGPRESPYTSFGLDDSLPWCLATIYLPGGSDCTRSFGSWNYKLPTRFVVCQ